MSDLDSGSDSEEPIFEIEVASPVNIALVKYWGKRDVSLILPFNDSISLTLDENYLGMSENLILVIFDHYSPFYPWDYLIKKGLELL